MLLERGSPAGKNNLDLLRFSLASMVFVSHAHDLSGYVPLQILSATVSSTMAVQAFFVISGFLIFQSYERSSNIKSYVSKRIRRIYPAYALVIVACAVGLAALSNLSPASYFASPGLYRYIAANLVFLNFAANGLPGVFDHNLVNAVNGALWTLKIEVAFYLSVPVIVWLNRKLSRDTVLTAIYGLSAIYGAVMLTLATRSGGGKYIELSRQLPGQMTYFVVGAAIFYHFETFKKHPIPFFALGVALFLASQFWLESYLRPIGLGLIIMSLAFQIYVGNFGKYGDFSYGIYIIHFPILQAMLALGILRGQPWLFALLAAAFVLGGAFAMWHLVEKRFLRSSSHYRVAEAVKVEALAESGI